VVIEDEGDVLELLSTHLGRLGCRVSGAQTGCDGVALALADPPDAVLVDIMLPDIDGREVVRLLRADERTASCPIVLCSVLDPDDLADLHPDAVLAKPFGKADIADLLRRLTTVE
jgi:CheY-like chemotaxis protein